MSKQDIKFLAGTRYHEQANEVFRLYQPPDFNSKDFSDDILPKLIKKHQSQQLPRLLELYRYFIADNNINYRPKKRDIYAADNRIPSDWAEMIVIMRQGQMLGNPLTYKNDDKELMALIDDFNARNNVTAHDIKLFIDECVFGRAFELSSIENDDGEPEIAVLDPRQTFVAFDSKTKASSLFAVRYFDLLDQKIAQVYTSESVITYLKKDDGYNIADVDDHVYGAVPVTEFNLNENRRGIYEPVLPQIDAYDLSMSELANFQQNSNDALLVISGAQYIPPRLKDESDDAYEKRKHRIMRDFRESNLLILLPDKEGKTGDAKYLIREYDVDGTESYKDRLVQDILRFTFTPDVTDSNFSGTQSGEAQKYKLMASDSARSVQERFFTKGVMRRLRLAANIWGIKHNAAIDYDLVNETTVKFTPMIPRTEQEIISNVKDLKDLVSRKTILETLKAVTGIDAEDELQRILDEKVTDTNTGNEDADENQ